MSFLTSLCCQYICLIFLVNDCKDQSLIYKCHCIVFVIVLIDIFHSKNKNNLSYSLSTICFILKDGLVINHHADHTLNSFCHWQSTLGGREGRHHDHAILLTGLDICSWKNEPCDTLGISSTLGHRFCSYKMPESVLLDNIMG